MNKHIALLLLSKIKDAPYLDRVSGVVQVVESMAQTPDGLSYTKRMPYSSTATADEMGKIDAAMIPDSNFKSCLYFEDGGLKVLGNVRDGLRYQSSLRLVCWLNTAMINTDEDKLMVAKVMPDICSKWGTVEIFNETPFTQVKVTGMSMPPADKNIFAPYDYDERATQYLIHPYEFFAIDLTVDFTVVNSCLVPVISTPPAVCSKTPVETDPLLTEGSETITTETETPITV